MCGIQLFDRAHSESAEWDKYRHFLIRVDGVCIENKTGSIFGVKLG